MIDLSKTKVKFSTCDIANGFLHKQIPDNIVYTYCWGITRHKILAVHEKTLTVFAWNMDSQYTEMFRGTPDEVFFLSPTAAVNYRIECIQKQRERLDTELAQIKKTYHL